MKKNISWAIGFNIRIDIVYGLLRFAISAVKSRKSVKKKIKNS